MISCLTLPFVTPYLHDHIVRLQDELLKFPLREKIEELEKSMLQLPQVDCPVIHRFGPGIYIREVFIPAGTFSVGHYQKTEHLNVMLKGRVTMFRDVLEEIEAPFTYVGKPGRKIGFIHEDMIWQNIYATSETDVEKLEGMFLSKSETWITESQKNMVLKEAGKNDYFSMLKEIGISPEIVKIQSENEEDQIPFPSGGYKVMVSSSFIDGKGLFATAPIEMDETIAPARISGKRTPAGRFTNHSSFPNSRMMAGLAGDIYLVAIRPIAGCRGGNLGEEITVDYRQAVRETIKCFYEENSCPP